MKNNLSCMKEFHSESCMIYLDFSKITQNAIFASRGKGTTCTAYTMAIFTDWSENIFNFFHGLITYIQKMRFFRDPKNQKSDFLFLPKNELLCMKEFTLKMHDISCIKIHS